MQASHNQNYKIVIKKIVFAIPINLSLRLDNKNQENTFHRRQN